MVEVTILGGPRDGEVIAMPDHAIAYRIPITRWTGTLTELDADSTEPTFDVFEMRPERVLGRWVLRWPREMG